MTKERLFEKYLGGKWKYDRSLRRWNRDNGKSYIDRRVELSSDGKWPSWYIHYTDGRMSEKIV